MSDAAPLTGDWRLRSWLSEVEDGSTRQVRHVRLSADGDTLELATDPVFMDGRRAVQRLTWERGSR